MRHRYYYGDGEEDLDSVEEALSRRDQTVRTWKPGDGLRCRFEKRAPAEFPCGRPVAVVTSRDSGGPGRTWRIRTWPVCINHIPGTRLPHEMQATADRAAREAVLVRHWDEYEAELAAEARRLQEEQLADLPESVRQLIKEQEAAGDE